MDTQIVKWGNSQGIRIPKGIMQQVGININDILSITADNNKIIIEKKTGHKTLEERASEYGGKLGPYTEYDWGEPQGREVW